MLALAADATAFSLIKLGDKYVSEQSKDKVVQIRSEKSVATMTPNVWYVVYYDPDATLKAVEVKFGAGEKMDVSRPLRLLEPVTGADKMLDSDKLKVDSDKALNIAKAQPLLANLTLVASQMWLQHGDEGPRWKVKLWAAKLNKSGDQADVGDVYISAADGSVVKTDLHPEQRELNRTGRAHRQNMTDWKRQCAAVIPCFNEAGRIASVITGAQQHLPRVIMVDDGSSDATAQQQAARRRGGSHPPTRQWRKGIGFADRVAAGAADGVSIGR